MGFCDKILEKLSLRPVVPAKPDKTVLRKIAENGGNIPKDLLD